VFKNIEAVLGAIAETQEDLEDFRELKIAKEQNKKFINLT